jgi:uncharacterized membrane protein
MTSPSTHLTGEFARSAERETLPSTISSKRGLSSALAPAFLCAIFLLNVYRAATQSITIDEASTWSKFVSQPLAGFFLPYDANNHVLNSLLCGISVNLFGLSEFSLRLPSVLAGGLYLASAWRISVLLFGYSAWASLTAALLATDPILLDHLSAARGYGMALAFWLTGVYCLLRALDEKNDQRNPRFLFRAGVLFGLAIAANLTSVFPATAAAIALVLVNYFRLKTLWDQFAVPAILIAFVFLAIPLSRAQPGDFYYGASSLAMTVNALADTSFSRVFRGMGKIPFQFLTMLHALVWPAVLILFAGAVLCVLWNLRSSAAGRRDPGRHAFFFCLALLSAAGLALALHYATGVLYPLNRTALYFIPLTVLSTSSILYRLRAIPAVTIGAVLVGCLCLAGFLLQIRTSYYDEWRFDAGTKTIAAYVGTHYISKTPLTIRASWFLEPSLNFYRDLYRERYHLNWNRIERDQLDPPGDVWILLPADAGQIERLKLHPVFRDRVSGAIVANVADRVILPR